MKIKGRNRTVKSRKENNAWRKKEIYKYFEILEADTIKQAKMKEKKNQNINSNEWEGFSKKKTMQ